MQAGWQGKDNICKAHLGMIQPVLILSYCYSRPAFRGKLFPVEVGFAARRPYCSIFQRFWLLDIQTYRAARYSKFPVCWIFKVCGLLGILRAARYSNFSGCSIFQAFGLLDILTFQVTRYSNLKGCTIFEHFRADQFHYCRAAR